MNILFVCTGNICRSPMAAGLMEHMLPPPLRASIKIFSAGTSALVGQRASENAVLTMKARGIDISSHRGRQVDGPMLAAADLILVMEPVHRRIIQTEFQVPPSKVENLADFHPSTQIALIEDPYGGPLTAYQTCARVMSTSIGRLLEEIPAGSWLTVRRQIMGQLAAGPLSLAELAARMDLTEKELLQHLRHVKRTVSRSGGKLTVKAARCRNCGFSFRQADEFKKPGRCPRCKQSRIDGPWLSLAQG